MKVIVIYRPNSDHGRVTEEFTRDFLRYHPDLKLEAINIDSREGIATASLYDVMQYPAIMVLQTDGQVEKLWEGAALPRLDEVAAYAHL